MVDVETVACIGNMAKRGERYGRGELGGGEVLIERVERMPSAP